MAFVVRICEEIGYETEAYYIPSKVHIHFINKISCSLEWYNKYNNYTANYSRLHVHNYVSFNINRFLTRSLACSGVSVSPSLHI